MGLVEKQTLISEIVPPLDNLLAAQLVDEFISMERRFIQRDWEPAELDGGNSLRYSRAFCTTLIPATLIETKASMSV